MDSVKIILTDHEGNEIESVMKEFDFDSDARNAFEDSSADLMCMD